MLHLALDKEYPLRQTTFQSLTYYQFSNLLPHTEIAHGIFTRLGGYSQAPWASLNTGHTVGDEPQAVQANHRLICQALGFHVQDIVSPYQVHGATVGIVDERDKGQVQPETDALITQTPGVLLMLRFADCTPIILYDPRQRVIGLAHAGWRGTVAQVVPATVQAMGDAFGCHSADLIAGIGPAIGPCCYEVGQEVADAVCQSLANGDQLLAHGTNGRWHLDLWAANAQQLRQAGVRQIETAQLCTACNVHEWFSHRAEQGKTGRFGALVGLKKPQ